MNGEVTSTQFRFDTLLLVGAEIPLAGQQEASLPNV
jgi:hypothetical protein